MSVSKARTGFDLINLTISVAVIVLFVHRIVGIGIGTVVSALFMGTVASKVTHWMRSHFETLSRILPGWKRWFSKNTQQFICAACSPSRMD